MSIQHSTIIKSCTEMQLLPNYTVLTLVTSQSACFFLNCSNCSKEEGVSSMHWLETSHTAHLILFTSVPIL